MQTFLQRTQIPDYLFEDWLHTSTALMRMIRIRKPYETL